MDKQKYYITTAIAYTSGSRTLGTRMRSCLRMRSPDIREQKVMMYISRQELTSTDRRFRKKQRQQVLHQRNS